MHARSRPIVKNLALGIVVAAMGCSLGCAPAVAARPPPAEARESREAREVARVELPSDEEAPEPTAEPPSEPDCAEPTSESDDAEDDADLVDDGFDAPPDTAAPSRPVPFAELSDDEIIERLRGDIGALGPISIGRTHDGVLIAGVRMPEGPNWTLKAPGLAWGTQETIDALTHAINAVAERFPDGPTMYIGDISRKKGGHFPPHVSHQSGRDVDLSYYLTEGHRWYATANESNLDRPRTWHFIRTLIANSDVDLILVDLKLQKILKEYALEIGEDPDWLDDVFQYGGKSRRPIIFHVKGHASHMHVRFYSPMAQELGRRAYRYLLARRLVSPPTRFVNHTVKKGETLTHLARRYKVKVEAIKKANGLKRDLLRLNKVYKIPQTGGIPRPPRLALPERRVPPDPKPVIAKAERPCRP